MSSPGPKPQVKHAKPATTPLGRCADEATKSTGKTPIQTPRLGERHHTTGAMPPTLAQRIANPVQLSTLYAPPTRSAKGSQAYDTVQTSQKPAIAPIGQGTQHMAGAIQLMKKSCPHCGGVHPRMKYKDCPANPMKKGKHVAGSPERMQSKAQRAFNAFQGYRRDFFNDNDITVGHVTQYFTEGHKLHGHGSGGNDDGENQATVDDANAFVGWYRKNYID